MIKILDMWRNLMKSPNTRENGLGNFAAKRSYLGISTGTKGYVATRQRKMSQHKISVKLSNLWFMIVHLEATYLCYVHISMLRICQSYLVWFVCLIFCLIWCWEAIHDSSFLTLGSSIAMLQLAAMVLCAAVFGQVCSVQPWCGHVAILCILSSVQKTISQ